MSGRSPQTHDGDGHPARPGRTVNLAERWRRYERTRSRAIRNELVLAYSPIVKYWAGRVAAHLPPHTDIADLVSYGLSGLIDAVERFDSRRRVRFETYAGWRIRGAIVDELRSLDWVPRAVRAEAQAISAATADLSMQLQRAPTDAELAAKLSLRPAELRESLLRVDNARFVALDEPWDAPARDGPPDTLRETLPDPDATDPVASAEANDRDERIAKAIGSLSSNERIVLGLYYHDDLDYRQIGEVIGLSKSRISQIHTKAVLQLRGLLQDDAPG